MSNTSASPRSRRPSSAEPDDRRCYLCRRPLGRARPDALYCSAGCKKTVETARDRERRRSDWRYRVHKQDIADRAYRRRRATPERSEQYRRRQRRRETARRLRQQAAFADETWPEVERALEMLEQPERMSIPVLVGLAAAAAYEGTEAGRRKLPRLTQHLRLVRVLAAREIARRQPPLKTDGDFTPIAKALYPETTAKERYYYRLTLRAWTEAEFAELAAAVRRHEATLPTDKELRVLVRGRAA